MAKKAKVQKRLAGVKIPKALRRGLRDLARTQSGKAILAEALIAAGGALAALESRPGSKTRALVAEKAPQARAKAKKLAANARESGGAFEDATRAFTESLRRRSAPEQAAVAATVDPAPTPVTTPH
jgi:hypothetical protein